MNADVLLDVRNLITRFKLDAGMLTAVDNVSFSVKNGETLGIVGESGCGKSVTAYSILNLVSPPGKIHNGEILFEGTDLTKLTKSQLNSIRGNDIAMIFQEPMTSLNPVYTIGNQIDEVLIKHKKLSRSQAREKTVELLRDVIIPFPEQRYREYPHQLSGGMRQRAMIAMALACDPKLLVCDEPTTALDVTVQARILQLINNLKSRYGMTVILITHDLAVISEMANRVIVMYAGRIVEESGEQELLQNPLHPYTEALLKSIPSSTPPGQKLYMIEGMVPNLLKENRGCMFASRCRYAWEQCRLEEPALIRLGDHAVRCHQYSGKAETQ